MRFGLTSLISLAGLLSSLAIKDECRKNDRLTQSAYNHGQKTWDKFVLFFFSVKSHMPNPSPTSKTTLDERIQNFSEYNILKVGGRENCEVLCKRWPHFMRASRRRR